MTITEIPQPPLRTLPLDVPDIVDEVTTVSELNSPIASWLESNDDADVFAFDLVGGEYYHFQAITMQGQRLSTAWRSASDGDVFRSTTTRLNEGHFVSESQKYYLKLNRELGSVPISYSFQASLLPDDYADGPVPTASEVTVGTTLHGEIEHIRDRDFLSFNADAGTAYRVELSSGDRFGEVGVYLEGQQDPVAITRDSLQWQPSESGKYYLGVNSDVGTYEVSIRTTADDHPDVPNDEVVQLAVGVVVAGEFEARGDRDVFAVEAAKNQWLTVTSNVAVRFLASDGQELSRGNHLQVAEAGTYFVEVTTPSSLGKYTVKFEGVVDDAAPERTEDVTEVLPSQGTVFAELSNAFDKDVYAIDVQEGDDIVALIVSSTGRVSVSITTPTQPNAGDTLGNQPAGRYFLTVRGDQRVSYELQFKHGPDAPNTRDAVDIPMLDEDRVAYEYHSDPDDMDVYAIPATQGELFEINAPRSTQIAIHDPNGELITLTSDNKIVWIAKTTGVYHFSYISGSYAWGVYPLELSRDSPADYLNDDYPDFINNRVESLANGATLQGVIEASGDIDVFEFTVAADQFASLALANVSDAFELASPSLTIFEGDLVHTYPGRIANWRPQQPGTYHVAVKAEQAGLEYPLRFARKTDDLGDQFNDSASLVEFDTPTSGVIDYDGDRDAFRFPVIAGREYEVVAIYGTTMDFSIGSTTDPEQFSGRLTTDARNQSWRSSFDGQAFLVIQYPGPRQHQYSFVVNEILGDDHVNEIGEEATRLRLNEAASGRFELVDDQDVFAIELPSGQEFEALSAGLRFQTLIYDQTRTLISQDPTWATTEAGLYYIIVSGEQAADYDITIRPLEDDHADAIGPDATLLSSNRFGSFEIAGDTDVFQLNTRIGMIVEFSIRSGSWTLQDANGNVVLQNAKQQRWESPDEATYYLVGN